MSYQEAKREFLSAKEWLFSGWYVDNVDNFNMAPYFSPYLRNCRLDGQAIVIRPGHSLFASLTVWSYPKGIWAYMRLDPSGDCLVVRHNNQAWFKLCKITPSWTVQYINTSSNIASDNRMNFIWAQDVLYCMNWSDPFWKLSDYTYTCPSTWVLSFNPAFWVNFNSSLFVAWHTLNPNKVYKSVADNYENFTSTWSDVFDFPEPITWLATVAEALFYFTKNTIAITNTQDITDTGWTITYTNRKLQVKEWATNHNCIVWSWNELYYVTSSNTICKIVRGQNVYGFETLDVSHRPYKGISKIMDSLPNDQSSAFGYFIPDKNLIKWHFRSQGSTINDIVVIYDITKDKFLVDTAKYFYDAIEFKWLNYAVSTVEWKVFLDEYWQDDEDSAIPFEYWTKEFYLSDPTFKKVLRETRTLLDINELAVLKQEIRADWALIDTKIIDKDNIPLFGSEAWMWAPAIWTFPIWMDTVWGGGSIIDSDYFETEILRTKGNLNRRCKKIQFRFINWSLAWKVRLKNITEKHEVLDPLTTNLTA